MKVPFRQQASDYDCGPTSLLNALCFLFDRKDIPPFVVHQIYKECLDLDGARGTSFHAIQDLAFWFEHYREERYSKFAVETEFISGSQVHLRPVGKIIWWLNAGGVALLCVHSSRGNWHYILGLHYKGGWLHCHDPSPRSKRFINVDAIQFSATASQQEPNLRIRCDWLDKNIRRTKDADERKYVLGNKDDRECLLLRRCRV
ncbi:hypothetical protein [Geobacter sp. AOG2]|uniref:hypothetical protein n=1 Tax=Geobacter sp. AOG2 TaxID=1566347 RepID=UPI001CC3C0AB|nr:hypothetical protein [Geobacter sp. AOG2]GFE60803.1 peptidase C39 [Geobacter sp. AOG2]